MLRLRLRIGLDPHRGLPAPKPLTRFGSPNSFSLENEVDFSLRSPPGDRANGPIGHEFAIGKG